MDTKTNAAAGSKAEEEGSVQLPISGVENPFRLPSGPLSLKILCVLLAAFLICLQFVNIGRIPAGRTFIQSADLLFVLVTLAWVAALVTKAVRLPSWKLILPSVALFVSGAVSLSATENMTVSLIKMVGQGYLIAVGLIVASVAAESVGSFAFVASVFATSATITGVLGSISAAMFYAGVRDRHVNIFLWNNGSIPGGNYPRIVVFFDNANMLCNYLLVGIGALAMLLPMVRPRLRKWLILAAVPITITTVFTLSTGLGGIGLGGVLGWMWWQATGKRFKVWREIPLALGAVAAAAGLTVITVFLMVPKGQGDVRMGPVDLSFETSGRVAVWKGALETFEGHPVRGIGIGNAAAITDHPRAINQPEKIGTDKEIKGPMPFQAHNVWLDIAAQMGLLGLISFVWLQIETLRAAWPRRRSDPFYLSQIAAVSCWVGAVGFHGFFGAFENSRQYWALFGLVFALEKITKKVTANEATKTLQTDTTSAAEDAADARLKGASA